MKNLIYFLIFLFVLFPNFAFALDVNGQMKKALLEKVSAAPSGAKEGRIWYNTITKKPFYQDNSGAKQFGSGAGGSGYKNFITNPSAAEDATTGWNLVIATSGPSRSTATGYKIDGVASFNYVGSGAYKQLLMETNPITIDDNIVGKTCEMGISVKGTLPSAAAKAKLFLLPQNYQNRMQGNITQGGYCIEGMANNVSLAVNDYVFDETNQDAFQNDPVQIVAMPGTCGIDGVQVSRKVVTTHTGDWFRFERPLAELTLLTSSTNFTDYAIDYPCANNYRVAFFSPIIASGTATDVNFGNIYWGQKRPPALDNYGARYFTVGASAFATDNGSFQDVDGANLWGGVTNYGRCEACASATAVCCKINSLPPGTYEVSFSFFSNADYGMCVYGIEDGTTADDYKKNEGTSGTLSYLRKFYTFTETASHSFKLRLRSNNGDSICTFNGTVSPFSISVKPFTQTGL